MDADGVVRGRRKADPWLDRRIDVLVLEELIILRDGNNRLQIIFPRTEYVKTSHIELSDFMVHYPSVDNRRSQPRLLVQNDTICLSLSHSRLLSITTIFLHVFHCLSMNGHSLLSLLCLSKLCLFL